MTLPLDILKELERLLAAQTAGELTDAEFEQLAALLRQSPEARNIYVAHLMLEAQLEQEHLPPLTVPALQSTPHAPREECITRSVMDTIRPVSSSRTNPCPGGSGVRRIGVDTRRSRSGRAQPR